MSNLETVVDKRISKHCFDKATDRTQSFSEKWDKYKGRDILPLWVADSDFETAPAVIEALQERVAHGIFGYTNQPTQAVKDAIVYHLKARHEWTIEEDWIVPLSSLVSGLTLSCLLAGDEGDEVIVPATIYPPFNFVTSNTKRRAVRVPMVLENERWTLDFEALEASITAHTKMVLFCNPQNPGGAVYTKQELNTLHEICERHDVLICSDEIHCDLVLDENATHIPFGKLNEDAAQRSITLMAASKTFNVAGLNFGFAIIPNTRLRKSFLKHIRQRMPDVNVLAQVATAAAFNHGEEWRLAQLDYLRDNRDYLLKEINAIPGMKMYPLEATFLAWVDVSKLLSSGVTDVEKFFENAGVGISAGAYFGDANFVRINFATQRAVLEHAVQRIKAAVSNL